MHQHLILIAAASQANAISPQTARYLGYGVVILAVLYLLNKMFGTSRSKG